MVADVETIPAGFASVDVGMRASRLVSFLSSDRRASSGAGGTVGTTGTWSAPSRALGTVDDADDADWVGGR